MIAPEVIEAVCLIASIVASVGAIWLLGAIPRVEVSLHGVSRVVPVREWVRRIRKHGRFWRLYR